MGTLTVRLDRNDEFLLDGLVTRYGDRSAAVREAIRVLAGQEERKRALGELVEVLEREIGPVNEERVQDLMRRYDL